MSVLCPRRNMRTRGTVVPGTTSVLIRRPIAATFSLASCAPIARGITTRRMQTPTTATTRDARTISHRCHRRHRRMMPFLVPLQNPRPGWGGGVSAPPHSSPCAGGRPGRARRSARVSPHPPLSTARVRGTAASGRAMARTARPARRGDGARARASPLTISAVSRTPPAITMGRLMARVYATAPFFSKWPRAARLRPLPATV